MESPHTPTPSGISSLPAEIVIVILRHLANPQNRVLGRGYDDLIRATLSNSYIRQVALATPSLWNRIEIADDPKSFELAVACLDWSGTQNLDIAVHIALRVGPKLPGVFALVRHVAGRHETFDCKSASARDATGRFLGHPGATGSGIFDAGILGSEGGRFINMSCFTSKRRCSASFDVTGPSPTRSAVTCNETTTAHITMLASVRKLAPRASVGNSCTD